VADALLRELYAAAPGYDAFAANLVRSLARAAAARSGELRTLDRLRSGDADWFQRPDRIGYVAYAERFGETLNGFTKRLEYLAELNVTYVHAMSVIRPREGPNDGGYAVVDYTAVDPVLGDWDDLRTLADELRGRGMSLCLDLVLNHTAAEHSWALRARAGDRRYRDYYLMYPDRTMPDRWERSLPEVFPTMAPGNFTFDEGLDAWVWTTFNTYQWDLNYANPNVFAEMLDVMLRLANVGVEVLRLDAIAFTWKRLGTTCQNQPEAHLLAQAYRALLSISAPAVLLKAEAIVAPTDLMPYLGAHRLQRPECQIAYHNQLMVMTWSSLATQDAALATQALAALPATPEDANFVTYLRCHDDIGWAVDDTVAGSLGIDGSAHRSFLASYYRGDFPGSPARGAAFSSNPESGDERTSGSAAALCGVASAQRSGDAAAVDAAIRRLLVGYGIVMGFAGIPLIYMGDELALDNDTTYLANPDHADDSRWMHRPRMPWSLADRRHLPGTIEHRVFRAFQHMTNVRRSQPAMSAGGETHMHRYPDTAVLAWQRSHRVHGRFFGLANVSTRPAGVPRAALGWAGLAQPRELLGADVDFDGDQLVLAPLTVAWYIDRADAAVVPPRPE
jgi:amylosucrase